MTQISPLHWRGSWTFLLYKQFLPFHYICQAAGHVSKNDLFGEIGAYKVARDPEGS